MRYRRKAPPHPESPPTARPREVFRAAEEQAVSLRKLLAQHVGSGKVARRGSIDDAVSLCRLAEAVSAHGRMLTAAEAFDLAERVAVLLDQLHAEVEDLLAS